jgi:hypothetical protein
MTRYTVVWVQSATDDLAEFWLRAAEKQAITDSADLADKFLAFDPAAKSDFLSEDLRGVTVGLLRQYFKIHEEDRKVEILYVKRIVRQ